MRRSARRREAGRRRLRAVLAAGALLLIGTAALPAVAQLNGGLGSGEPGEAHARGGSGQGRRQAAPTVPPLKIQPEEWPRLDPGALLCQTKDSLTEYQEALADATADAPPRLPTGCARILERTPVSIVQRDGQSREEVRVSATPQRTGWTNAWLPDKLP